MRGVWDAVSGEHKILRQNPGEERQESLRLCVTALFMALNVIMSSFGIPVPGGHLYLCDVVICTAAILLDPFHAFLVGGVGSFLGDLFFYPAPMLVSLITHGLQAVIISLCAHKLRGKHPELGAGVGVLLGGTVMVIGYTLGRAFLYSTPEYAVLKLPFEILQAAVGAGAGILICFHTEVPRVFRQITRQGAA